MSVCSRLAIALSPYHQRPSYTERTHAYRFHCRYFVCRRKQVEENNEGSERKSSERKKEEGEKRRRTMVWRTLNLEALRKLFLLVVRSCEQRWREKRLGSPSIRRKRTPVPIRFVPRSL
jgi:hypothetical protein